MIRNCYLTLGLILFAVWTRGYAAPPTINSCRPQQFVVAVDVGHSRAAPGAISASGRSEFEFNVPLGKKLLTALHYVGFEKSFLINKLGNIRSLKSRTKLASEAGASLFLSIHHDSVQPGYLSTWIVDGKTQHYSDQFQGYSLFVSKRNPAYQDSLFFAGLAGRELTKPGLIPTMHHAEPIPGENRPLLDPQLGIYRFDNLVILHTATVPAVLLEAGVIVNRREEKKLLLSSYQDQLVKAVVNAIILYCESKQTM